MVDTLPLLAEDLSMWMGERLPIVVLLMGSGKGPVWRGYCWFW